MKWEKYFWGLFFLLGAVFIILGALGVGVEFSLFTAFLVVFFVACIIKSLIHFNIWGIIFPLAFLGHIFEDRLGLTRVSLWQLLCAALFLCIGFTLIFGKIKIFPKRIGSPSPSDNLSGNDIYIHNTFASSVKFVSSENLCHAKIESSFGSLKVRFENAKVSPAGADITFEVSFSGVELFIPKEWKINNQMTTSFGAVEEKNAASTFSESPLVTLKGNASFSGITIFYV